MPLLLRISLYIQFILGMLRMVGAVPSGLWTLHVVFGVLAALLALIVLKPTPHDRGPLVSIARFAPFVVLLLGFAIMGAMGGQGLTLLHVILGIASIGLVEATLGRRKRSSAGSAGR